MSSRHYVGRHRPAHAAAGSKVRRAPKSLSAGFVLPTAAAAALVVTATGASMAEATQPISAAPGAAFGAIGVAPKVTEQIKAQAEEAAASTSGVTERRAAVTTAEAALAGRQQESQRVARNKARVLAKAKKVAIVAAEKQAKAEAEARKHDWVMPVIGANFTSAYKWRWGRQHEGNDLAAPTGTPLYAMSTGEVTGASYMGGRGNTVMIRFWDGTTAYYQHMNTMSVSVGEFVSPGQTIGTVGNTGNSFGAHLHLEIHPEGSGPIDPHPWMQAHGLYY